MRRVCKQAVDRQGKANSKHFMLPCQQLGWEVMYLARYIILLSTYLALYRTLPEYCR